ncbi:glycosyltransferase family 1 protein [Gelatoporia subvermispora B]|uniref:Glycosyltransferase family 1 protein n=1 Tax=Ceriporiopsis subvermispora (strain B) TaxID=914234 RepID=M2R5P4_CERS8|nr:glycosyltransferase family 1 protein [Gelatoporia subvermispora B]
MIDVAVQPKSHIVFIAYESWGAVLRIKPVYVTFFVVHRLYDRVRAELQRNFAPEEQSVLQLVRVVGLHHESFDPIDTRDIDAHFEDAYGKLVKKEPVTCMHTSVQYDAIPPPEVVFIDFYALRPLQAVRGLSGKSAKVYVWFSGSPDAFIAAFGPASIGGKADLYPQVKEEVAKTGRDLNEVAMQIMHGISGRVVRVPGLPPMYDYEHIPQEVPLWIVALIRLSCLTGSDGVVFSTPEPLQPEAIASVREWFTQENRVTYSFGPLVPSGTRAADYELVQSGKGGEIQQFLDSVLKSHGEHSLVYWSFGSVFWPTDPAKVWVILDVLMEKKIPFIMSHASPFGAVPEAVQEKVQQYGLGILCPWTPQQTILGHSATGWFVTHAGLNGVLESLSQGVPMICWPFTADQPTNAAHLSNDLNVAYELLEVRSGLGLRPIFRTGKAPTGTVESVRAEAQELFGKAFEEDGAEKRANALKMKEAFARCWEEGGSSEKELRRLVGSFGPV